jgi:glutathionylspermidine synthase
LNSNLRLISVPESQYPDYRTDVIFQAYKWDPQVNDQNTIAKHILLVTRQTARQLGQWAQQLSRETMQMEEALIHNLPLAKELGLPSQILKTLPRLCGYKSGRNIRLMRFDFHPTETGWAISEVNSDVPGGLAEASVWPQIAERYAKQFAGGENLCAGENTASLLFEAFQAKIRKNGTAAFVHATSYSDDRQVMQFLGDYFKKRGLNSIYAAPDHIKWANKKALCVIKGRECEIDGIVRFFPLEWLVNLPKNSNWQGYYDSETPSCNNPVSIFAQSKRLPLIWDSLGVEIPAWKKLLPQTSDPKSIPPQDSEWIYKPALGRVGEGISIKEAVTPKEFAQIQKAARKYPKDWAAQRRFKSLPVPAQDGVNYHVCIGVFAVDGKNAGFYGRISPYPRIDSNAIDIPILISEEGETGD